MDDVAADTQDARSPTIIQRLWANDRALSVIVFMVALAIRLVYVLQMRENPLFSHPTMDELYHDQWGTAISQGKEFVHGPYFRAPLYPFFLGFVFKVFGHGYLAPRLAQAVIGAVNCGLLFWIGRLLFDRSIAFVSGIVAASYLMLVYFDAELLLPVLEVFFDLWIILLLILAVRKDRWWLFGLCGLAMGFSSITRPNIIVFAPAVAIWLWTVYGIKSKKAWSYIAVGALGVLLPILPVTLRNSIVGHDWVPIASQGGVNFYIGNNPDSDGMRAVVPHTPGDWWGGYYATIAIAEEEAGHKLKPSEVSDYYYKKAYRFMAENPGQALGLTASKLRLFWAKWEIPNNKYEDFWAKAFTPVADYLPFTFSIVGPLGLLGVFLSFRRAKELFPLWGFILVYMATVVAFFVTARYRIPVVPPLILCAVFAVFEVLRRLSQSGFKSLLAPAIVLVLAAQLVLGIPTGDRTRNLANAYNTLGRAYLDEHQPGKAIEALKQALTYNPQYFTANALLAEALRDEGNSAGAEQAFKTALATPPAPDWGESIGQVGIVEYDLGRMLAAGGKRREAVIHLVSSLSPPTAQTADKPLHELVWILSLAPEADVRNPKQALEDAKTGCPDTARAAAQALDDLALALAANGQFAAAQSIEQLAVERAGSSERAGYEKRLSLYRERKTPVL